MRITTIIPNNNNKLCTGFGRISDHRHHTSVKTCADNSDNIQIA